MTTDLHYYADSRVSSFDWNLPEFFSFQRFLREHSFRREPLASESTAAAKVSRGRKTRVESPHAGKAGHARKRKNRGAAFSKK